MEPWELDIQKVKEFEDGWVFDVTIKMGSKEYERRVTLTRDFQTMLWADPELIVRESFDFLLNREPPENILSTFDLSEIKKYFPEYLDHLEAKLI